MYRTYTMGEGPKLWSIRLSPWSLTVKWAIKVLDVDVDIVEYHLIPVISELTLRLKLRKWRGTVTVPVLFFTNGQAPITEGYDIVKWADAQRSSQVSTLLPDGVDAWQDIAQQIMKAQRCVLR